ncbi:MAG: DUF3617 domain-containing protein [Croceibacterium sp.]
MSRTTIGVAALALALAACSGGNKTADKGKAAGPAEAGAQLAAAQIKLQPGEYESTMKVLEFAMPGMPAAELDRMKATMGGQMEKPHRYCFTPEQAAAGPRQLVSRMQQGECKMSDFNSSANSVSGTMQCALQGRGSSTTKFEGTYASDGSTMTMESDQQMPGLAGKATHMKMRVDTHRVGECTG